jgi:ABC-type polysaccharide/polyol phosphate transport system ATPase subunit
MIRIECEAVSKSFSLNPGRQLLRDRLKSWIGLKERESRHFYALRDVTLRIRSGESVALIGRNGAGKSTLLSLLTGISVPDYGRIAVNGRVAALLELSSGFHPDLTGSENLMLNASLLGFTRKEALERYEDIVEFAGIGEFIDQPIRTYSSGMILRLAFSIAIAVDPEILIIDEILAVGDQSFQAKCFDKVLEFRRSGKTIVAVSHADDLLLQLCDRGIWLDAGRVVADGEIRDVLAAYEGHAPAAAASADCA